MNYYQKYLKYKTKYLSFKNKQIGGVHENLKKKYTGAGCLIIDQDNENILLVMEKRFNWNTIGGKIDWEDYSSEKDIDFILKDSAIREVYEETANLIKLDVDDLTQYIEIDDTRGNLHRTYIVRMPKNKMINSLDFIEQKNSLSNEYKAEHHINTVTVKKVNLNELKKQLDICAVDDTEYYLDTRKENPKYNYLCNINGCDMIINRRLRDVIIKAVQENII